ncbi:hypothetical protein AB1N83_011344 [Pleurotus pulmonarius]
MDYFSGEHAAGPSNYPHPHAEEIDSATPPSSPSERGEKHRSNRHTPTARTYAQLLGRTADGHHSHSRSTHRSRSKYSESRSHSHRSDHRSDHHYNDPSSSSINSSSKSKAKVQKLNSLLLLTSERLTAEVTRSRTAEGRLTSALTLLTKCRTEQVQVTSQVSTLNTQLELYKAQLARAQDEILRAQRIVDEVEQGKKDAEEAAARARARARKLEEESVVRQAMEQGRREGYRQGLRQGQQMALERISTRTRGEAYEDDEEDDDEYDETPTSADSKSDRSVSSAPKRNKFKDNEPVHIPILAEPVPLRVPSSRATSIAPSVTRRAPSYSRPILADSRSPESIQPLDPQASSSRRTPVPSSVPPQHASSSKQREQQRIPPQPARDNAPSISRHNTVIPPDGFIPVLGSDSMINLPAPYELSQTPKTIAASMKDGKEDTESSKDGAGSVTAGRMRSGSRSTVRTTQEQQSDVNSTRRQPTPIYAIPRPAATMSSASISQFDILSPPNSANKERFPISGPSGHGGPTDQAAARDAYDRRREEYGRRTPQTPTPAPRKAPFPAYPADRRGVVRTPSQEITEEWRSANSSASASKGKSRADPAALAPPDADPYASGLRSPPRGPRRPKRIVMPQPLSLGSAAGMMQQQQHAPPPPILYQDKPHQSKIPFPRQSPENQGPQHRPSPLEWLQKRLTNRTASNSTVPQISVEPPSHSPSKHSQDGDEIDIDPVLLTPDDASHHVALPPSYDARNNRDAASHSSPVILLPSDELPPGFVVTSMTPKSGQQGLPPSNTTYDKMKIYADAEPHTRPSTSATTLTGGTHHKSEDSLGKNGSLASPASLSRPFSIFSDGS